MPRYTDLDLLFDKVEETTWYHINKNGDLVVGANSETDVPLYKHSDIMRVLSEAPEADVAPRSEVERLKAENERLVDLVKELQEYNEAWVEDNGKLRNKNKNLAREIFEEIEKNSRYTVNFVEAIEFESEEIRKAKLECYRDCLMYFAKLKKKYTEGEDPK